MSEDVLMRDEIDASTLPLWRYKLRQRLIPVVRWETPYLATLQSHLRTPVLDQYFAFSANLGVCSSMMEIMRCMVGLMSLCRRIAFS